jgi:hypothetical protein
MKFRLLTLPSLPLLLSFAALAAAQVPNIAPPPIKMGLWQSSVTLNSTAMGPAGGHPITNQSCYTPDSWKQSMQKMQSRQPTMNCTTSNMQQDSHKLSFDGQCSEPQGMNVTYHVEMFLDSDEAMHGSSSAKMSGPQFPQAMTMTSVISSKFVSSDCGDIKPGESKPVH